MESYGNFLFYHDYLRDLGSIPGDKRIDFNLGKNGRTLGESRGTRGWLDVLTAHVQLYHYMESGWEAEAHGDRNHDQQEEAAAVKSTN